MLLGAVQIEQRLVQGFHFIDFHSKILNCFKSGYKLLGGKTGLLNRVVLSVDHTLKILALLCDQESMDINFMIMQCQQYLTTQHTYKKKKVTRKSPKKRFFVEPEITFEPSPTKIAKVSVVDHAYSKKSQPEAEVSQLRKHVKILKQKVRQRNKRMKCMKDLMKSLKEKQLIAAIEHEVLSHNFNGVSKHLFDDQMKNSKTESNLSNQYTMETKQFAMTLHYYSPKAYEFVCKILCLPHSSTIRAWSSSVDCEPGFLGNVIKSIGNLVQTKKWMSDVVLIVDAMALHKGTTWDLKSKS